MANNVSNVSFGSPYEAQQMEIERRRALASALQQQGSQPIENQMSGGWAVPISPWQGLAKLAQAGVGAYGMKKASEDQAELGRQAQERRGADTTALVNALAGRQAQPGGLTEDAAGNVTQADALPAMTSAESLQRAIPMMQTPEIQQAAIQALMGQQPKKPEPFTLKADEVRFGPDGQPMAFGLPKPEKPEGFNLAPEHSRYDANGRLVVTAPPSPTRTDPPIKPPPGYRATPEGNLEAIPGGPADLKLQGSFNQDTAALNNSSASMDRLAVAANEALNHPGLKSITGVRGMIPNMPGSAAADAQAKLNTLKSQVAFGVLQDMRNNSKTGGALGNVSDAEGKRLEANLAALENSQSVEQMQDSLRKIVKYTEEAKDRLRGAYNLKHANQIAPQQPAPKAAGGLSPQEEQELAELRKRFGR